LSPHLKFGPSTCWRAHSVTVNQYINRQSELSKIGWHICWAFSDGWRITPL
jgi:hypothetical protein